MINSMIILVKACAVKKFLHADDNEFSHQYDGKNQTLLFIYCMFKNVDNHQITDVAEKCANENFLEDVWISDILLCAKGDEGNQIMREMGAKTLNLKDPLEHSPWIVINGERNPFARSDLQKVICDNLLVINFSFTILVLISRFLQNYIFLNLCLNI
jgi:hypothetical protein